MQVQTQALPHKRTQQVPAGLAADTCKSMRTARFKRLAEQRCRAVRATAA